MDAKATYKAVEALGRSLVGTDILAAFQEPTTSEVQVCLERNQAVIELARSLLQFDLEVPLEYRREWISQDLEGIDALRNLARTLSRKLELSGEAGDLAEAVAIGRDLLALANGMRRGGLVVDMTISNLFESIAVNGLRKLRKSFGAAERISLIRLLEQHDGKREAVSDIIERDRRWEEIVGPESSEEVEMPDVEIIDPAVCGASEQEQRDAHQAIFQAVTEMSRDWTAHPEHRNAFVTRSDSTHWAQCRMLSVDAALREHAERSGEFPASMEALSEWCHWIPNDPFTQRPFCYRRNNGDFLLYSPGPSLIDHGGVFGPRLAVWCGKADLGLDEFDCDGVCPATRPTIADDKETR